jgi:peptidoglycan/LPS O-acetylase OafA/YrhL
MRQLDSLRAVAAGMVILSHWAPSAATFWFNGSVGVQLFFVISGFLITGILLDARDKAEAVGVRLAGVLKSFYARRALRIFPLFYGTLAITFVLGYRDVREFICWLVPYLANVLFAIRGRFFGVISHFWSLAVEEQFYLAWPMLMLFTSRRFLLPLVASAVAFAPLFRFVCHSAGLNETAVDVLPFASLDTLGLGAMLALMSQRGALTRESKAFAILRAVAVAGASAYFGLNIVGLFIKLPEAAASVIQSMLAPTVFGVVWLAARGVRGPASRIMEWTPLVYLGRISYGLYVFHPFIPGGVTKAFRVFGVPMMGFRHPDFAFMLNLTVLVGVSSVSWHFFEKKFIDLKRFFPYVAPYAPDHR